MSETNLLAGIDAGGTSFKFGVATLDGVILETGRVSTTQPDATVAWVVEALEQMAARNNGRLSRLGIASFGPVDVSPPSPRYGSILNTPKEGWSDTPLLRLLCDALGCEGDLDTDVNGALEAELIRGSAKGARNAAYVTVGTGIGVGVNCAGAFVGRPSHPEMGHIRIMRHPDDSDFAGVCPFHGDCLEGLVSAPALMKRYGNLEVLPGNHAVWQLAGFYLAQLAVVLVLTFRVDRIVFGGGVATSPYLLDEIRRAFGQQMNGYVEDVPIEELIVPAFLGDQAGLVGGVLIAQR